MVVAVSVELVVTLLAVTEDAVVVVVVVVQLPCTTPSTPAHCRMGSEHGAMSGRLPARAVHANTGMRANTDMQAAWKWPHEPLTLSISIACAVKLPVHSYAHSELRGCVSVSSCPELPSV